MWRKKWRLWTGVAGLIYGGCLAYMFFRQDQLLYQPDKKPSESDRDHIFLEDIGLFGWVDNPGKKNAIIYYGGSSEAVQLRRKDFLSFSNVTRYFIPYRGFWPNQLLSPTEILLKHDAKKIFDYVKKRHKKVFIVGRSLGTSMALHVAARRHPDKVALITPFNSVLDIAKKRYRAFPVQRILRDWHEAHKDAVEVHCPLLVFIAETDKITPRASWEELRKSLPKNHKEEILQGVNHTTVVESQILWQKMQDFFHEK